MRLREPFVKKHVHTWVLSDHGRYPDYVLKRECSECPCVQEARYDVSKRVPDSVLAYADLDWK